MILSLLIDDSIERSLSPDPLSHLLEVGLRIDIESLMEDALESPIDMSRNKCSYHLHTKIEIDRSEDCFEGIRQNIGILMSCSEMLSTRELDSMRIPQM